MLLIGHGTAPATETKRKFNLVGPDLSADEWAALVKPIRRPRRVRRHDAAAASRSCARWPARGRIVITATDSPPQEFETVFPEFFVGALRRAARPTPTRTAGSRSGRRSSSRRRRAASGSTSADSCATERPLLDDTGDGVGREAEERDGPDGAIAQVTYLQPRRASPRRPTPNWRRCCRRRAASRPSSRRCERGSRSCRPASTSPRSNGCSSRSRGSIGRSGRDPDPTTRSEVEDLDSASDDRHQSSLTLTLAALSRLCA